MCSAVNRLEWLLIFFFIPVLAGCASVDPVVKVGLVSAFEGADRAVGYDALYSARLAVREINQAGGIGGYRVALVALDDAGDIGLAADTARSLVLDPGVVAVVGHWQPATTAVAAPIYAAGGIPFLPLGETPFVPGDPTKLDPSFHQAYEAVTPFTEVAGPYAGPTYDAFQLLWLALEKGEESQGELTREAVAVGLAGLEYEGLTGTVYGP